MQQAGAESGRQRPPSVCAPATRAGSRAWQRVPRWSDPGLLAAAGRDAGGEERQVMTVHAAPRNQASSCADTVQQSPLAGGVRVSKGGDGSALVVVLLLVLVGHAGAQNCTDLSGTIRGGMCDGTKWAMQACVPLNNTKEQYAQILSGLAANDLSIDACKSTQEAAECKLIRAKDHPDFCAASGGFCAARVNRMKMMYNCTSSSVACKPGAAPYIQPKVCCDAIFTMVSTTCNVAGAGIDWASARKAFRETGKCSDSDCISEDFGFFFSLAATQKDFTCFGSGGSGDSDDLFPTKNESKFSYNPETSQLARTFARRVAAPIKQMFPRSYSATTVRAQMQVTGFNAPVELGISERSVVRKSIAGAINKVMSLDGRCCVNADQVIITHICFMDLTGCISSVLKSRPQDCGDGKNIDPEECDDGNVDSGDGCSGTCSIEEGFYCMDGSRFQKDTCRSMNETFWLRWSDESVAPLPTRVETELEREGRDQHLSYASSRRQKNSFTGSIMVAFLVDFDKENAALGNKTMKIRHMHQALGNPDYLRRFQEQMRESDVPVVVSWNGVDGEPQMDVFSGSPRAFFAELMDGRDLLKCFDVPFTNADGTACAYLDYVAMMTMFGFGLSGLTILACVPFCCARFFPCCYWIGAYKPCKFAGRQCGGALPTKRRKPNEILLASACLIIGSCTLMGMTVVGFRCTEQVLVDIGRALYAIEKAECAPTIFRKSVSNSTTALKTQARETLAQINFRLSSLPEIKAMTKNANQTLENTRSELMRVRNLIEGFGNVSGELQRNPCTYIDDLGGSPVTYDPKLMLWRTLNGEESPTYSPRGIHLFPSTASPGVNAIPSTLPNGRPPPICNSHSFFSYVYSTEMKSCPCCRDCAVYDTAITDTLNAMPTPEELEKLNTPIPADMISQDIDDLMQDMDISVQLVDEWLKGVNVGFAGIKFALRAITNFMPLLYAWTWGTSWLAVLMVWYGVIRDKYRWLYGAYLLGAVAISTVLFPIVGLGSMAVIPMSDFCNGIPVTGGDTSVFLKTFSTEGDIMEVNRTIVSILTDCFTKKDGVLWNVVDLDRSMLKNRLLRYDLSKKVNTKSFEEALNTEKRDLTASFTNHFDSISRMTSDNKVYGYDSQPDSARPASLGFQAMHPGKNVWDFQRGGVIDGSGTNAMTNQINTILSSAMSEDQLLRGCNFRTQSAPAQSFWKSLGGVGKLTDVCAVNVSAMYSDYMYGCCPGDRFWGGSREPSQVVVDYNIYKKELQSGISRTQEQAGDAGFHLEKIKRLSGLLEANISRMVGDANDAIDFITDELIKIGSCTEFNKLYENVREPMCADLSSSMDAFWVACFLAGAAWVPYFWALLRNGKIIMLRNGLGELRPRRRPKKGGGVHKVAAAPTDLLNQV